MILPQIDTKEYYVIFMQQLDMLLLDLYGYDSKELEDRLQSVYDHKFTHIIKSVLASEDLTLSAPNIGHIDSKLRMLKEDMLNVNNLELHIALYPNEAFLQKIRSWVALHLPSRTLIDIRVDRSILAGARIYYNGSYFDGTFSQGFSRYEGDTV